MEVNMEINYQHEAQVYKAFCDENRLRIIELLTAGERCACELLKKLPIGQSTLSHHMKILAESGIVTVRKESKWMYYSLNDNGCEYASMNLRSILKKNYATLVQCECNEE